MPNAVPTTGEVIVVSDESDSPVEAIARDIVRTLAPDRRARFVQSLSDGGEENTADAKTPARRSVTFVTDDESAAVHTDDVPYGDKESVRAVMAVDTDDVPYGLTAIESEEVAAPEVKPKYQRPSRKKSDVEERRKAKEAAARREPSVSETESAKVRRHAANVESMRRSMTPAHLSDDAFVTTSAHRRIAKKRAAIAADYQSALDEHAAALAKDPTARLRTVRNDKYTTGSSGDERNVPGTKYRKRTPAEMARAQRDRHTQAVRVARDQEYIAAGKVRGVNDNGDEIWVDAPLPVREYPMDQQQLSAYYHSLKMKPQPRPMATHVPAAPYGAIPFQQYAQRNANAHLMAALQQPTDSDESGYDGEDSDDDGLEFNPQYLQ